MTQADMQREMFTNAAYDRAIEQGIICLPPASAPETCEAFTNKIKQLLSDYWVMRDGCTLDDAMLYLINN